MYFLVDSKKLSKTLNVLLFQNNINAKQLAEKVNLSSANIHRLLTGKAKKPLPSTLEPIANFFSLSVEQLIGLEDLPDCSLYNKVFEIPLHSWHELSATELSQLKHPHEKIAVSSNKNQKCFATKLQCTHMWPLFPEGTVLIFDPDKKVNDGNYVLVKTHDNMCLFRQIFIGDESMQLFPISPDHRNSSKKLNEKDKILGVLVEARQDYTGN